MIRRQQKLELFEITHLSNKCTVKKRDEVRNTVSERERERERENK